MGDFLEFWPVVVVGALGIGLRLLLGLEEAASGRGRSCLCPKRGRAGSSFRVRCRRRLLAHGTPQPARILKFGQKHKGALDELLMEAKASCLREYLKNEADTAKILDDDWKLQQKAGFTAGKRQQRATVNGEKMQTKKRNDEEREKNSSRSFTYAHR